MDKIKIVQVVKSGDKELYVLNRLPKFIYHQVSGISIVGNDEGLYMAYSYMEPNKYSKAFGGSEFDLVMDDNSIVHCYGQWWHGINSDMNYYLPKNRIYGLSYMSKDSLEACYVFTGATIADKDWLDNLIKEYKEEIKKDNRPYFYEYFEYKNLLKNGGKIRN